MRTTPIHFGMIIGAWCAGFAPALSQTSETPTATAPAADGRPALGDVQYFESDKVRSSWEFSDGREWPGARGALTWSAERGRTRGGALVLAYDFDAGGNYVAAITPLPAEPPVRAVRLWLHKPAANLMIFRAVDAHGEVFQKDVRFDYRGWQQLEIGLDGWVHRWGGDGKFDEPATAFHILIESQGGNRKGELLIDEVQWVYESSAADPGTRTTLYTESEFDAADGFSPGGGAAGTRYASGLWTYRFSDEQAGCRLHYGRSALGRPQALRLTLESDGTGHEVRAIFGSHFQNFSRALGTLDNPGRVTLTVPMGDMRTWEHSGGQDDGVVRYPLRLEQIVLVRKGAQDAGELRLWKLEYLTDHDAQRPIYVVPQVEREGDAVRFRALLRSLAEEPLWGELKLVVRSLDEVIATKTEELTVPAGGTVMFDTVVSRGSHLVLEGEFEFLFAGGSSGRFSTTIAAARAAPAGTPLRPESRIGAGLYLYRFHGHPAARDWLDRMCRLAAGAGVKWTREEFHWNWIERTQGTFDFSFFDQLVDAATTHGISVYGLMCYWTEWSQPPFTDEFIEHYCNYLRAVVTRYKDRIRHWEIWNEPNIFFWPDDKERYPVLLKRAYETIKAIDPEAEVLGCSTAGIDGNFIRMVLAAEAPFDALTIHPYRHALDTTAFIRELRQTRTLVGGRDVWITEMGWPSQLLDGLTERAQAGYVARTYIAAIASGAVRSVAWYDFREDGDDPFYHEHHFGLVRGDLTPKIGYQALATVGELLAQAEPVGDLELGDELEGYLFRHPDGYVAALWSPDTTRLVRFAITPDDFELRSVIGTPAASVRGEDALTVRLERGLPVYVLSSRRPELRVLGDVLPARLTPATVHPGEVLQVSWEPVAGVVVQAPVPPHGWSDELEVSGTRAAIQVPGHAVTGMHEVLLPVTVGDRTLTLPLHVEVVPKLLRR